MNRERIVTKIFHNLEWSFGLIREFLDSISVGIGVYLNMGFDYITNFKGLRTDILVVAVSVIGAASLQEDLKDRLGKLRVGGDISEIGVELVVIGLIESGGREDFNVKRKSEFPANSSNTSGNISVINGSAIPSILGSFSILKKTEMGASIIAGDGLGFVEKAVVAFNTHALVVATG